MHSWTKVSLILAASLAVASAPVLAQTRPAAPPPPSQTPAAAQAATPASVVDVPRAGVYGAVMQGNAASDNTVDDYLLRPTLIGNRQYVSVWGGAGALTNATFALQAMGYTWFGSYKAGPGGIAGQGSAPDEIRGGLTNGAFAAGLMIGLAKSSEDNGTTTRTTSEGDAIGLFGNLALGGSDVYGEISVHTDYDPNVPGNKYEEVDAGGGATIEDANSRFRVMAGWKRDATTQGTHALNVMGTFDLGLKKEESTGDSGQLVQFNVVANHGYILRQTPTFSAFIGANGQFLLLSETTKSGGVEVDGGHMRFAVSPNFGFQQALKKGFELFAGGSFNVIFDSYENRAPATLPVAEERWDFMTTGSDVAIGMRWRYENIAIDASVNEGLLFGGPNFVSGAVNPMFAQLGLTVGF